MVIRDYLIPVGMLLVFLGFMIIFFGAIIQANERGGEVKGGAIVFIGPIPIAFGTDRGSLILVSVLMLAIMVAAWLLWRSHT